MEYISRLKNIKQEISRASFGKIEDSMMVTILIAGLPETYNHFLETLKITNKWDKISFDALSELLATHDKTFTK